MKNPYLLNLEAKPGGSEDSYYSTEYSELSDEDKNRLADATEVEFGYNYCETKDPVNSEKCPGFAELAGAEVVRTVAALRGKLGAG